MESAPLLPSNASGEQSTAKGYYFLNNKDAEEVIDTVPEGTSLDEFAPRILTPDLRHPSYIASRKTAAIPNGTAAPPAPPSTNVPASSSSNQGGVFSFLFGKKPNAVSPHQRMSSRGYGEVGSLVKLRKAPIKIEPKVFFANERTFLAWMHLSVILAGASIAILAFADESNGALGQLYGVVLLPVAISFIVYSMYQYNRRATMIRHRHPGPYEDTVGPTVLSIMLMVSILAQFALKMYAMASTTP